MKAALDRAEAWLLEHLPQLRRATPDAIYNNWGHAYAIQALVHAPRPRTDDATRREKIEATLRQQIELLERYECVDGGWGYYDFDVRTQKPSGSTISFVTGAAVVSLDEAQQGRRRGRRAAASTGRWPRSAGSASPTSATATAST